MPKSKIIMSHKAHNTVKVEAVVVPESQVKTIPCACACTRKAYKDEKLVLLVVFVTILMLGALLHLHLAVVAMSIGAYVFAVLFTAVTIVCTFEAVKAIDEY